MMKMEKHTAAVGEDGLLSIVLPIGVKNVQIAYTLTYEVQPQKMTQQEWEDFVNRTYGSLADNPLDEVEQLPFEDREEIE